MPTESAALHDWPCTNPDHLGLCTDGHVHVDHRKTVSEIFREHGYPPMDDERRAQVEATRLAGLVADD